MHETQATARRKAFAHAITWGGCGDREYRGFGTVPDMSTVVDSHASLAPRSTAANRRQTRGRTRRLQGWNHLADDQEQCSGIAGSARLHGARAATSTDAALVLPRRLGGERWPL